MLQCKPSAAPEEYAYVKQQQPLRNTPRLSICNRWRSTARLSICNRWGSMPGFAISAAPGLS